MPEVLPAPPPTTEVAGIEGNGTVAIKVSVPPRQHAQVQAELNKTVMAWLKAPAPSAPQRAQAAAAS